MKKTIMKIFQTTTKPFLKQGLGRWPVVRSLSTLLTIFLTPLNIEGDKFYCPPAEGIDYIFGASYNPGKEFLKEQIKKGDVVLDIGANAGLMTLFFAKLVGEKGKVYPFEANPRCYSYLKKNALENGYGNIIFKTSNKAVSDKSGEIVKLYLHKTTRHDRLYTSQERGKYTEVKTVKLDDIFCNSQKNGERIDFIHMDIVGGEIAAIPGMASILKNNPQLKMFLDFYPAKIKKSGKEPTNCLRILRDLGFKISRLGNKELILVNKIEDLMSDDGTKTLFCRR